MSDTADLAALLVCPRCRAGGLSLQSAGWICDACSSGFPQVGGIPWLFADPQAMLSQWRARLSFLLLEEKREALVLGAELQDATLPDLTRRRLEHLRAAHEDHARRLSALLAPLGPESSQTSYATHLALRTRLPLDQGLTNYYVNLHRDWAWGEEENRAALEAICAVCEQEFGRTLVLGAGAGRLAYDLHMSGRVRMTVAADFNPLLLFVARDVTAGGSVELYEFPLAPRSIADHAVLRRLSAPKPVSMGFRLVACDALNAPFRRESFDTVLTPWLIDIVGERFDFIAARVNALLRPGGRWINFGSLAFTQGPRAQRTSSEEALAVIAQAGFAAPDTLERRIPYMHSPASRHGRLEDVLLWSARKQESVAEPHSRSSTPEWLVRNDLPVPALDDFRIQAASTRVHAFLMALIDGRRTLKDMAQMLIEQKLLAPQDAESSVRTFLMRMYEDAQR